MESPIQALMNMKSIPEKGRQVEDYILIMLDLQHRIIIMRQVTVRRLML